MSFFQEFRTETKTLLVVALAAVVIAVGGILLLQVGLGPSSPTPSVQPVQQTPPPAAVPRDQAEFDFAEWQTYRSDEFGFEVKYPPSWRIERNFEQNLSLPQFELRSSENDRSMYIEITTDADRISYIQEGRSGSSFLLSGNAWQKFLHTENNPGEFGDFRTTLALSTTHLGKNYIIRLTPNEDFSINWRYDQILSTFRFVE